MNESTTGIDIVSLPTGQDVLTEGPGIESGGDPHGRTAIEHDLDRWGGPGRQKKDRDVKKRKGNAILKTGVKKRKDRHCNLDEPIAIG